MRYLLYLLSYTWLTSCAGNNPREEISYVRAVTCSAGQELPDSAEKREFQRLCDAGATVEEIVDALERAREASQ